MLWKSHHWQITIIHDQLNYIKTHKGTRINHVCLWTKPTSLGRQVHMRKGSAICRLHSTKSHISPWVDSWWCSRKRAGYVQIFHNCQIQSSLCLKNILWWCILDKYLLKMYEFADMSQKALASRHMSLLPNATSTGQFAYTFHYSCPHRYLC
jgi:hypothetical protein